MTPYQKHVAKWKGCERCDLHCRRKQVVHLRGSIPCDVLFVGEAPGPSEDVIGKPFVGPAGKLLDSIIEKSFLVRVELDEYANERLAITKRIAFTNLVGCIPLDDSSTKFAEPPSESIKACMTRLQEIESMCNPRIIVWVGKLAAKWGMNSLEYVAGNKRTRAKFNQVEIVHPAAILRAPPAAQGLMIQKAVVTLSSAVEEL